MKSWLSFIVWILIIAIMLPLSASALAADGIPFEEYGAFTDAADETQVNQRADWYYNTCIAAMDYPQRRFFSIREIVSDIRILNGEFYRNSKGEVEYDSKGDIIDAVNDIMMMFNYDNQNIIDALRVKEKSARITPIAPLFKDGSVLQKEAARLDAATEAVAEAVVKEDDEVFLAASREWGDICTDLFSRPDAIFETLSVRPEDGAGYYTLFLRASAIYELLIDEYEKAHSLNVTVSRTAGCKTEESLNKIMGELDSIPEDSAARRIGRAAEYADQELTLAQYLYRLAADYFEDRYASEYACDISADEETEVSDEPEGMIWDLTDGRLTISGRGPMPDYVTTVPPWQEQKASIETVVIEPGITHIGAQSFQYCSHMLWVSIPKTVTSIGKAAFYKCTTLHEFVLPENLSVIGDQAFDHCLDLVGVEIPEGVTKIGESVFNCCESLFRVTIPASVTEIGYAAFNGCSRLTFVYYLANLSDWEKVKIGPYNKSLLDADLHTRDHM